MIIDEKIIHTYIWKNKDYSQKKMVEMSAEELQNIYDHTCSMLWNSTPNSLGKSYIRKNIITAINNCNAELLMRYLIFEDSNNPFHSKFDLFNYIQEQLAGGAVNTDPVESIFYNIPNEYCSSSIQDLLNACLQIATPINKHMIPSKFILSQGLWLTPGEMAELTETGPNGERKDYREVIKERLFLPDVYIKINPTGLTYKEFRALIQLEPLTKISSFTEATLRSFRDKIFVKLLAFVDDDIKFWDNMRKKIENVAEYRKVTLCKNYD